ncbi:porin family protein [Reichenbachiella sp. MALMAid0571]|uniref:porin family protein n=1 Tax=Reichenbachiella sp. MALMAid0571 TaxID=3143939 RepID=UPI0032DE53CA
MKKLPILIIAIACIVFDAKSQSMDHRENPQFGLKIGSNYSNVYDSQGEEFEADGRFGLATGVFITIPIGKFIGLQPEVLYSRKGFKGTGTIQGLSYDVTRTTNYIDIPLMFSVKPSPAISLVAGPQYSFLLKQKDEFTNVGGSVVQEQEFENDNIRKNTMGFIGGVDFNLNDFVIGTRVGWDMINNHGDGTSSTPRYKNVWYQLTFGFRL